MVRSCVFPYYFRLSCGWAKHGDRWPKNGRKWVRSFRSPLPPNHCCAVYAVLRATVTGRLSLQWGSQTVTLPALQRSYVVKSCLMLLIVEWSRCCRVANDRRRRPSARSRRAVHVRVLTTTLIHLPRRSVDTVLRRGLAVTSEMRRFVVDIHCLAGCVLQEKLHACVESHEWCPYRYASINQSIYFAIKGHRLLLFSRTGWPGWQTTGSSYQAY